MVSKCVWRLHSQRRSDSQWLAAEYFSGCWSFLAECRNQRESLLHIPLVNFVDTKMLSSQDFFAILGDSIIVVALPLFGTLAVVNPRRLRDHYRSLYDRYGVVRSWPFSSIALKSWYIVWIRIVGCLGVCCAGCLCNLAASKALINLAR
jgi:hypothetical protein